MGYVCYVRLLCPVVGGDVAQPPHAARTAMPRTIVIPLPNADIYELVP